MATSDSKICRWGFLSTSSIGKKNWHAIQCCENATLVAVASRSENSGREFVDSCQQHIAFKKTPDVVVGYDELLARDDIDAVYIPLPTGLRKPWVIKAAEAGKHVLCEKPCATNIADLKEMTAVCQANNVQFMDGVMLMHTLRIEALRPFFNERIGKLMRIYSQMSFASAPDFLNQNIRTDESLEPYGCLGDLGWYNIRIALIAANWQMPQSVRATTLNQHKRSSGESGVPLSMSAEIFFEGNLSAGFFCSFETHNQQWAVVSGDKGMIKINDFVLPYSNEDLKFEFHQATFDIEHCQFEMLENRSVHCTSESGNNAVNSQEAKLFRKFSSIVNSGNLESSWSQIALKTQCVLDACLESANRGGELVTIPKL